MKAGRRAALAGVIVALALALTLRDPAISSGTATIRAGSAEGVSGEEATVRLETLNVPDPGLGAFTIDVTYDPSVASPVGCNEDPGDIFDTVLCNTSYRPNSVRVGGFRVSSGGTGSMALADITFRLVGQVGAYGGVVPALTEFADTQGRPITPLDIVPGSLCVTGASEAPAAGTAAPSLIPAADGTRDPGPSRTTRATASSAVPPVLANADATAAPTDETQVAEPTAAPSAAHLRAGATHAPEQDAKAPPGRAQTAVEETDGDGWHIWVLALAGAAVGVCLVGYATYRSVVRSRSGPRA